MAPLANDDTARDHDALSTVSSPTFSVFSESSMSLADFEPPYRTSHSTPLQSRPKHNLTANRDRDYVSPLDCSRIDPLCEAMRGIFPVGESTEPPCKPLETISNCTLSLESLGDTLSTPIMQDTAVLKDLFPNEDDEDDTPSLVLSRDSSTSTIADDDQDLVEKGEHDPKDEHGLSTAETASSSVDDTLDDDILPAEPPFDSECPVESASMVLRVVSLVYSCYVKCIPPLFRLALSIVGESGLLSRILRLASSHESLFTTSEKDHDLASDIE